MQTGKQQLKKRNNVNYKNNKQVDYSGITIKVSDCIKILHSKHLNNQMSWTLKLCTYILDCIIVFLQQEVIFKNRSRSNKDKTRVSIQVILRWNSAQLFCSVVFTKLLRESRHFLERLRPTVIANMLRCPYVIDCKR